MLTTLASRAASKRAMRATICSKLDNIRNRRIRSRTQGHNTDNKRQQACRAGGQVLLRKRTAGAQQAVPHNRRNPEREPRHEKRRGQRQQVRENGDSLGDDPRDDGEDDDEHDP